VERGLKEERLEKMSQKSTGRGIQQRASRQEVEQKTATRIILRREKEELHNSDPNKCTRKLQRTGQGPQKVNGPVETSWVFQPTEVLLGSASNSVAFSHLNNDGRGLNEK